ncbi:hypothetical protein [Prosthecobacter sp.]|uniref:hypothetical protein n=1 Tax=Prosthecobacter sp. TaxID=1965333 RepID=UPI001DD646CF|nr:hypothetical protein [Prosthecobacter sp.]MCB1276309.1 hypothetical protein [Prosthecobacter sp.]
MNRALRTIFFQSAVWLTPLVSRAADERVIMEAPVRVVASASPDVFPESWCKSPVLASGEELPEEEFERVRKILGRALAKYPPQILQADLKAVYVLAELRYSGVITSGTNSRTCVYLKIGDEKKGFTDTHIESVFHAEFSSILLRNHARHFDKEAWQAVNPPGFRYLGNGVDAVKQKKAGLKLSDALHEIGFLKEYSQSTLENDFNALANLLFSGDANLWEISARFPKIRRKVDLALAFYQKLDPAFTELYFRSFTKQNVAR